MYVSLPLEVPPLGECPKDKGGAVSGEEKVSPPTEAVTDEVEAFLFHQSTVYSKNVSTSSDLFGSLGVKKPTFPSRGRLSDNHLIYYRLSL